MTDYLRINLVTKKCPADSYEKLHKLRASVEFQEDDKKQMLSEISQKRESKRILE